MAFILCPRFYKSSSDAASRSGQFSYSITFRFLLENFSCNMKKNRNLSTNILQLRVFLSTVCLNNIEVGTQAQV